MSGTWIILLVLFTGLKTHGLEAIQTRIEHSYDKTRSFNSSVEQAETDFKAFEYNYIEHKKFFS